MENFRVGDIAFSVHPGVFHFNLVDQHKILCQKEEVGVMYLITTDKAKVTCQDCLEWLHA